MLERYTRERQRGQGKKGLFNLEDEDEGLDGFEEGTALGGLTHGGRSVVYLPGDDFETQGLGEDDEEDKGGIHRRLVSRCHIGGLYGDQQDEEREDQVRFLRFL
jgi:nucleolar protein 14